MFSIDVKGAIPVREQMTTVTARGSETQMLLVDDSTLHRENLAAALVRHGLPAPSVAWDLPSLVASLDAATPDVVVLDLATRDSQLLVRAVADICPCAQVIVVGASEDDEDGIVACAEAGVAGYLMRTGSLQHLLTLIRDVAAGGMVCPPRVAAVLLHRLSDLVSQGGPAVKELALTVREAQILSMLDLRPLNQDIATQLSIAVRTVENPVRSVLRKLSVNTRDEAATLSTSTRMEVVTRNRSRSRFT
ncbi:response regulator transcription factor [Mycolicibacterium baixiangningiae]|uniref:response regulator transcription factor n=1 Tax=Mycolicibacterium baixiangningiae TaxID=2761578 RepID=UPI001865B3E5|nr:response regulator transcription factor [Mycolicibacterium baixiangningiae]